MEMAYNNSLSKNNMLPEAVDSYSPLYIEQPELIQNNTIWFGLLKHLADIAKKNLLTS